MAGMTLNVADGDYWAVGNFEMDAPRGARLPAIFGSAMSRITRNMADPTNPMRVRGQAPELFDHYARTTSGFPTTAKSLWTGVEATAEYSWFVACRGVRPDVSNIPLIGNLASSWIDNPTIGASITGQTMLLNNVGAANDNKWRLTGQCTVYSGNPATVSNSVASTGDVDFSADPFVICMVRRNAAGGITAEIVGVLPAASAASALPAALGGELVLGTTYTGVATGQADIAFVHMADEYLPDAEAYMNCRQIRRFCDDHGCMIYAPLGIPA